MISEKLKIAPQKHTVSLHSRQHFEGFSGNGVRNRPRARKPSIPALFSLGFWHAKSWKSHSRIIKNNMFYVCFARAAKTVKRHKYLSNGAAISTPFQLVFWLSAKITKSALKIIKTINKYVCFPSFVRARWWKWHQKGTKYH